MSSLLVLCEIVQIAHVFVCFQQGTPEQLEYHKRSFDRKVEYMRTHKVSFPTNPDNLLESNLKGFVHL